MDKLKVLAVLLVSLVLAGCASSKSGDVYSRDQTRREMIVRTGVVESVREVTIGGGKGQIVGAIIGAVLGGMAGTAIEENATKKNALEITVSLDNGTLIAVVQEMGEIFHPGERVRVLSGSGSTRVTH